MSLDSHSHSLSVSVSVSDSNPDPDPDLVAGEINDDFLGAVPCGYLSRVVVVVADIGEQVLLTKIKSGPK